MVVRLKLELVGGLGGEAVRTEADAHTGEVWPLTLDEFAEGNASGLGGRADAEHLDAFVHEVVKVLGASGSRGKYEWHGETL